MTSEGCSEEYGLADVVTKRPNHDPIASEHRSVEDLCQYIQLKNGSRINQGTVIGRTKLVIEIS